MSFATGVGILLFVAVIASDVWLAKRIRAAIVSHGVHLPGFEGYRYGGSPLGLAYNVYKLGKLPAVTELSDPDLIAISRHARVHRAVLLLFGILLFATVLLQLV